MTAILSSKTDAKNKPAPGASSFRLFENWEVHNPGTNVASPANAIRTA